MLPFPCDSEGAIESEGASFGTSGLEGLRKAHLSDARLPCVTRPSAGLRHASI